MIFPQYNARLKKGQAAGAKPVSDFGFHAKLELLTLVNSHDRIELCGNLNFPHNFRSKCGFARLKARL
jgi:hypothetical protein